jgi:hypothetical protein
MTGSDAAVENGPVLAAFAVALAAGLPVASCYRAGIDAWKSLHPDHAAPYAAKRAVAIILAARAAGLAEPMDESIPSCSGL